MIADRFLELAPIAALGALDGDEGARFERHLPGCAACRDALSANEALAGRLPFALADAPPSAGVRDRVLAATQARRRAARLPWLTAAAALALALVYRAQRDDARAEARSAVEETNRAHAALAAAIESASRERASTLLVADRESRLTALAGLRGAPRAHARMIWNPSRRDAVLVVGGLPAAPAGQAYEVWVIADGAPAPAGVFHPEADGTAVFRLPRDAPPPHPRTFAVTLEPAAGVPAPTGPMVLAGSVG